MKNKNILLILLLIVAICVLGMIGFVIFGKEDSFPENVNTDTNEVNDTYYVTYNGEQYQYNYNLKNILFIGVDKIGNFQSELAGNGGQSDALILMSMDKETDSTRLLEISRESMTDIKIYDVNGEYVRTERGQLTLQYAYGDGKKKSCMLTKDAVSKLLLDIPISSYVALTVEGMIQITDAMGGVEMTIPKDYTELNPLFTQGTTLLMDGKMVEDYVRSRDIEVTGSNNDRMERQTQFLESLATQLQGREVTWYAKLFKQVEDYMITDLSLSELEKLSSYTVEYPIEMVPGETVQGEEHDEFIVDNAGLQDLIIKMFYKHKK